MITVLPSSSEFVKPPLTLRALDSLEEFFWLLEQRVSAKHVLALDLEGETTEQQWTEAFRLISQQHPLLLASIVKVPGERPCFLRSDRAAALGIRRRTENLDLRHEMEHALQEPWSKADHTLLRLSLFHHPRRSALLFTAHHSAFDGTATLLILDDLLTALVGEKLGPYRQDAPSLRRLLNESPLPRYSGYTLKDVVTNECTPLDGLPPVQVQRLLWTAEETSALLRQVKQNGASVTAALLVALARAGAEERERWRAGIVQCVCPFDARVLLDAERCSGLLIGTSPAMLDLSDAQDFWQAARHIGRVLAETRTQSALLSLLHFYDQLLSEEQTPAQIAEIAMELLSHDLMLTNYAGRPVRTNYRSLKITSLFTGNASPAVEAQKVSVITTSGRLNMTLVSRTPIPRLLERARELLSSASLASP